MSGKTHIVVLAMLLCCIETYVQGGEPNQKTEVSTLLSPNGQFLAYGVGSYGDDGEQITRLMICTSEGAEQKELKQLPIREGEVQWLGNNLVVCTEMTSSRYFVVSMEGNTVDDIQLPTGCDVLYKRLSPDGSKVAFTGGFKYGLFVVELGAGEIRQLLKEAVKTAPAWSPDSRRLAISNAAGYIRDYPLVIIDVETNEVTAAEINGVGASWSNDGRFLAFTTEVIRGGGWWYGIPYDGRIGVLDIETGQISYVTPAAVNVSDKETGKRESAGFIQPVWSPDGKMLACRKINYFRANNKSERNESDETWIADVEVKEAKKVADGFGPIAWSRDSRSLYILKKNQIECVDINSLSSRKLVTWEKAKEH